VYALKLKQFVFSNEYIQVGISEIDNQIRDHYPRTRISLTSGSGTFIADEIVYQSANTLANATTTAIVHSFTPNTHIDVIRVKGKFVTGNVKGNTSSSEWIINTISDTATMDDAFEDIIDNNRIQNESDSIIDFTEVNPFGEP
jgi:hypothetical protein